MNGLFLSDSYLKECEATVSAVKDGKYITLDSNLFYPKSGGQDFDTGKLVKENEEFNVIYTGKFGGNISLEVDKEGLKEGDRVKCILNWERRYKHMRGHTSGHVLVAVMTKDLGVLITGNEIREDKIRFDFNLENFDREKLENCFKKANELLKQDLELKIYTLPREEAMKIEGVVKLANALPPDIKELRIVEIPEIDLQADGGTHVKNLKEVGEIELLKLDNKGKNNRRVYYRLKEQ